MVGELKAEHLGHFPNNNNKKQPRNKKSMAQLGYYKLFPAVGTQRVFCVVSHGWRSISFGSSYFAHTFRGRSQIM